MRRLYLPKTKANKIISLILQAVRLGLFSCRKNRRLQSKRIMDNKFQKLKLTWIGKDEQPGNIKGVYGQWAR
jgi:hypothetical protein